MKENSKINQHTFSSSMLELKSDANDDETLKHIIPIL
jgi:hypothetical protein